MTPGEIKKYCDQNGIMGTVHYIDEDMNIHLPMYDDFIRQPIEELNLSVRSFNALKRARIDTIKDLCIMIMTESGLESIRNLGKTSIKEIKEELLVQGYERLSDELKYAFWADIAKEGA